MSETVLVSCDGCGELIQEAVDLLHLQPIRGGAEETRLDFCNYECLNQWILDYRPEVADKADRAEYDRLRKKFEGK